VVNVTSNPPLVRLLTRSQVRSLLRWPELIEAIAQALIDASSGESATAASQLHVPGAALHLKSGHLKPGALARPPVLSVKANLRPEAGLNRSGCGVVTRAVRKKFLSERPWQPRSAP
jgi:hypothetical protein